MACRHAEMFEALLQAVGFKLYKKKALKWAVFLHLNLYLQGARWHTWCCVRIEGRGTSAYETKGTNKSGRFSFSYKLTTWWFTKINIKKQISFCMKQNQEDRSLNQKYSLYLYGLWWFVLSKIKPRKVLGYILFWPNMCVQRNWWVKL